MSVFVISRSSHVAIAKCIRNAEIPVEPRSRLIRDLCVFFSENNPVGFDQKRFVNICVGLDYKDAAFTNLAIFDKLKYLDEVWDVIKSK